MHVCIIDVWKCHAENSTPNNELIIIARNIHFFVKCTLDGTTSPQVFLENASDKVRSFFLSSVCRINPNSETVSQFLNHMILFSEWHFQSSAHSAWRKWYRMLLQSAFSLWQCNTPGNHHHRGSSTWTSGWSIDYVVHYPGVQPFVFWDSELPRMISLKPHKKKQAFSEEVITDKEMDLTMHPQ